MSKRMDAIKGIITQFVLIVFSVVLGLYLSERIEEQKQKRASEELLATIKSELEDNMVLLEDWVPYHQEVYRKLDSLSTNAEFIEGFIEDKFSFFQLLTRGSFMKRSPGNDAWDIAKAHPLTVNIDYDKLLILSKIYKQQESSFEPGKKLIELFDSKDVNAPADAAANLQLMSSRMRELVARELQLLYYYREAEGILDLQVDRGED